MVYGPCKCGFPSTYKCTECDARLCGNCKGDHVCTKPEPVKIEQPKPAAPIAPAPKAPSEGNYQNKRGRPAGSTNK